MTLVQLEPDLEAALTRFSAKHDLSKEHVISNALHEYLEDESDARDVETAMSVLAKDGAAHTSAEVRRELGLDD